MSRRGRNSKKRLNSLLMMLVLTAMLLIFSTYAWFSSNKEVSITGLKAKVAAAEGLQISLDAEKWSNTIDISKEKLETLGAKNNHNWPDTLNPVSTTGQEDQGDFVFYAGDVSGDGSYLTNANANTTGMIAFDLYFKNSSSGETDPLQLNIGSLVEEIKNNTEVASTGDGITGLMYSARVGMLIYSNTADYTTAPDNIRALQAGSPVSVIWEPSAGKHIQMILDNDDRITKLDEGLDDAFVTLALQGVETTEEEIGGTKTPIVKAINKSKVEDVTAAGGNADNFEATKTMKTAGKITNNAMAMTDVTGAAVTLKGNQITKARVYIWLEGQDPDCVDVASQGQNLNVVLNMTKPARDDAPAVGD